jgi:hypothetical protein
VLSPEVGDGARSILLFFQKDEILCLLLIMGDVEADEGGSSGIGVVGVTGLEGLLNQLLPEILPKLV